MNPFLLRGYIGPEYFCDREKETDKIINSIRHQFSTTKAEIGSPGTMQAVINALKEKQVIIKEGAAYRLYDVFLEHYLRYFG